jgi:hypothetical protein
MFSNKLTDFVVSHFYPAHLIPTWPITVGVEARIVISTSVALPHDDLYYNDIWSRT